MKKNESLIREEKTTQALTEYDELVLSQIRPYAGASILCLFLALVCLFILRLRVEEMSFWLCLLTALLNAAFLIFCFVKTKKIRK